MSISGVADSFLGRIKIPFRARAKELDRCREMELEARAFE